MTSSQRLTNNRGALRAVVALILASAAIQAAVGFNTVLFPVRLEAYGFSKGLIGLCLAFEMGAVLAVVGSIDKILARLGLLGTMLIATGLRLVMLVLSAVEVPLWCLGCLALASAHLASYLQTWLNGLPLGRLRGLVSGCYSSALSLGTASGPILFNQVVSTESNQVFQANMIIVLFALVLIVPCIGQSPLMTNQGRCVSVM